MDVPLKIGYLGGVVIVVDDFDAESLGITVWYVKFKNKVSVLESIKTKISLEELTKVIRKYNLIQDNSFLYFRSRVDSEKYSKNEDKRNASALLTRLIRKHGYSLHKFPYQDERKAFKGLISDLQISPYWEAVNILGLGDAFIDLRDDHDKFYDKYMQRVDLKVSLSEHDPVVAIQEAYQAYIDLMHIIDIFQRTEETNESLNLLVKKIKEHADIYNAKIKANETRKETKKKKEEEENEQNPNDQDPVNDTPNNQDAPNAGNLPNDDIPNQDDDLNNGRD